MKRFKQALKQLTNGVPVHRSPKKPYYYHEDNSDKVCVVLAESERGDGTRVYRICVFGNHKKVLEMYEAETLHQVRRIAVAYYPSLARYFGPARMYVGI